MAGKFRSGNSVAHPDVASVGALKQSLQAAGVVAERGRGSKDKPASDAATLRKRAASINKRVGVLLKTDKRSREPREKEARRSSLRAAALPADLAPSASLLEARLGATGPKRSSLQLQLDWWDEPSREATVGSHWGSDAAPPDTSDDSHDTTDSEYEKYDFKEAGSRINELFAELQSSNRQEVMQEISQELNERSELMRESNEEINEFEHAFLDRTYEVRHSTEQMAAVVQAKQMEEVNLLVKCKQTISTGAEKKRRERRKFAKKLREQATRGQQQRAKSKDGGGGGGEDEDEAEEKLGNGIKDPLEIEAANSTFVGMQQAAQRLTQGSEELGVATVLRALCEVQEGFLELELRKRLMLRHLELLRAAVGHLESEDAEEEKEEPNAAMRELINECQVQLFGIDEVTARVKEIHDEVKKLDELAERKDKEIIEFRKASNRKRRLAMALQQIKDQEEEKKVAEKGNAAGSRERGMGAGRLTRIREALHMKSDAIWHASIALSAQHMPASKSAIQELTEVQLRIEEKEAQIEQARQTLRRMKEQQELLEYCEGKARRGPSALLEEYNPPLGEEEEAGAPPEPANASRRPSFLFPPDLGGRRPSQDLSAGMVVPPDVGTATWPLMPVQRQAAASPTHRRGVQRQGSDVFGGDHRPRSAAGAAAFAPAPAAPEGLGAGPAGGGRSAPTHRASEPAPAAAAPGGGARHGRQSSPSPQRRFPPSQFVRSSGSTATAGTKISSVAAFGKLTAGKYEEAKEGEAPIDRSRPPSEAAGDQLLQQQMKATRRRFMQPALAANSSMHEAPPLPPAEGLASALPGWRRGSDESLPSEGAPFSEGDGMSPLASLPSSSSPDLEFFGEDSPQQGMRPRAHTTDASRAQERYGGGGTHARSSWSHSPRPRASGTLGHLPLGGDSEMPSPRSSARYRLARVAPRRSSSGGTLVDIMDEVTKVRRKNTDTRQDIEVATAKMQKLRRLMRTKWQPTATAAAEVQQLLADLVDSLGLAPPAEHFQLKRDLHSKQNEVKVYRQMWYDSHKDLEAVLQVQREGQSPGQAEEGVEKLSFHTGTETAGKSTPHSNKPSYGHAGQLRRQPHHPGQLSSPALTTGRALPLMIVQGEHRDAAPSLYVGRALTAAEAVEGRRRSKTPPRQHRRATIAAPRRHYDAVADALAKTAPQLMVRPSLPALKHRPSTGPSLRSVHDQPALRVSQIGGSPWASAADGTGLDAGDDPATGPGRAHHGAFRRPSQQLRRRLSRQLSGGRRGRRRSSG